MEQILQSCYTNFKRSKQEIKMDPNIAKIISSRVRRNQPLTSSDETTAAPQRSPLKQRNFDSATVTRGSGSPVKSSPKKNLVTDSPSDTIKRILSRESLETNVKVGFYPFIKSSKVLLCLQLKSLITTEPTKFFIKGNFTHVL